MLTNLMNFKIGNEIRIQLVVRAIHQSREAEKQVSFPLSLLVIVKSANYA